MTTPSGGISIPLVGGNDQLKIPLGFLDRLAFKHLLYPLVPLVKCGGDWDFEIAIVFKHGQALKIGGQRDVHH